MASGCEAFDSDGTYTKGTAWAGPRPGCRAAAPPRAARVFACGRRGEVATDSGRGQWRKESGEYSILVSFLLPSYPWSPRMYRLACVSPRLSVFALSLAPTLSSRPSDPLRMSVRRRSALIPERRGPALPGGASRQLWSLWATFIASKYLSLLFSFRARKLTAMSSHGFWQWRPFMDVPYIAFRPCTVLPQLARGPRRNEA